jgi:hypothetical protein
MLSEERMNHIVHTMLDAVWKLDWLDFVDEGAARKEAKRAAQQYQQRMENLTEVVRKRILSQKNAPPEYSRQWDTLFEKYLAEEWSKLGG